MLYHIITSYTCGDCYQRNISWSAEEYEREQREPSSTFTVCTHDSTGIHFGEEICPWYAVNKEIDEGYDI